MGRALKAETVGRKTTSPGPGVTRVPTISSPEERKPYPPTYRGMHRLVPRVDGRPRCVACYMCATACPAQRIYIEVRRRGHREVPGAVRDRRAALHRLRLLRGGLPEGRDPHGHRHP